MSHLVLGFESLVEAKENIFSERISPPIACSLDEEMICIKAIKEARTSTAKAVSTVTTWVYPGCVQEASQGLGEAVICDTTNIALVNVAESWIVATKIKPVEQLPQVINRAQGFYGIGDHGCNHLLVPELIRLAVILQHHADIRPRGKTDLKSG